MFLVLFYLTLISFYVVLIILDVNKANVKDQIDVQELTRTGMSNRYRILTLFNEFFYFLICFSGMAIPAVRALNQLSTLVCLLSFMNFGVSFMLHETNVSYASRFRLYSKNLTDGSMVKVEE
jgi:hypothetical protein